MVLKVGRFENEGNEQEQRFVEENIFLTVDNNDSVVFIER
jgi:hypothetical protein